MNSAKIQFYLSRGPYIYSNIDTRSLCSLIGPFQSHISQLRDFAGSGGMASYGFVNRSPVVLLQEWGLLADIGGIFGLYLGLSIVALFEFVELVVDLMIIIFRKFTNNKTAKETDGKENLRAWACNKCEKILCLKHYASCPYLFWLGVGRIYPYTSCDCSIASEATLMNMSKWVAWVL